MSLTEQEMLIAQQIIFELLKAKKNVMDEIRTSSLKANEKWLKFIEFFLPLQMEVIQQFGFANDQKGLSEFNTVFTRYQSKNDALRQINQTKWIYIYENCFGINSATQSISLETAKRLVCDIVKDMISEPFLLKIDGLALEFKEDTSLIEKRKRILELLTPLHQNVMEKYGFTGDDGYIQAQRALMEHYHDPIITQKASEGQIAVFKRARLIA